MATLSVRQIAQNCLGTTGNLSVNSHVYGYIFRDDRRLGVRHARRQRHSARAAARRRRVR